MNSTLSADKMIQPSPKEAAELQTALQEIYAEILASNARVEASRLEIDTLRTETQVMLDSLHRMLSN